MLLCLYTIGNINIALPVNCWQHKCCSVCVLLATKMLLCLCIVSNKNVSLPMYYWQHKCYFACVLLAAKMLLCLCTVGNINVALPVNCWQHKCCSACVGNINFISSIPSSIFFVYIFKSKATFLPIIIECN